MSDFKNVNLRYIGNDIEEGMDPHIFAQSIDSFAKYIELANTLENGKTQKIEFKIHRVSEGSLSVNFILKVWKDRAELIEGAKSIVSLMKLVKEGVDLSKHLGGKPAKESKSIGGGKKSITNNEGHTTIYNIKAENLTLNLNGSKHAQNFANIPLLKQADELRIEGDEFETIRIENEDSKRILPISDAEELLSNEMDTYLTVTRPVLEGNGKWSFSDGTNNFSAEVLDEEFLVRVNESKEAFAKGDQLYARIKTIQTKQNGRLKSIYKILEVYEHSAGHDDTPDLF